MSLLMSIALVGLLATKVAQLTTHGQMGARSVELKHDLQIIRDTISKRLDCRSTLNVATGTALPVTCPNTITLRMRDGRPISPDGRMGDWAITSRCSDGELIISASRTGEDPLTKRPWSLAASATDLFAGASDFCREYLDSSYSACSGTYPLQVGRDATGPVCCREVGPVVANSRYGPGGILNSARAYCAAHEFVHSGTGGCNALGVQSGDELGFLQGLGVERASNSFLADCHGRRMIDDRDATAWAIAVCCPRS